MASLKEITNLWSYLGDKYWYFQDDHLRRKGTLIIDNDDTVRLNLRLKSSDVARFEKRFDVVTTSDRTSRLSMFDCSGYAQYSMPGSKTQTVSMRPYYLVHQMFDNGPVPFSVSNVSTEIPGINLWFDDNLLDFDSTNRKFINTSNVYYKVEIAPGISAQLNVKFEKTISSNNQFTAKHKCDVRIDFDQPREYPIAIAYIKELEHFFNFIFPEVTESYHFTSHVERPRKKIDAFHDIIAMRYLGPNNIKRESDFLMLFGFADLDDPAIVIKNWFRHSLQLQAVWEVLRYLRTSNLSEEARFISLVGALESIHRKFFDVPDPAKRKAHHARLKNITHKLTVADDKTLIMTRLRNAHEPTLSARIHELNEFASRYGIKKLTLAEERKIVDTRNDQVHSLGLTFSETLTKSEMFSTNIILAMQVKAIIMHIIGVKDIELTKIVSKSSQFKSYYRD